MILVISSSRIFVLSSSGKPRKGTAIAEEHDGASRRWIVEVQVSGHSFANFKIFHMI
jgi:hypothetical protein